MKDYSRLLKPMELVYKEVARSIITTDNNLSILLAGNGVSGVDKRPSWVPDWRTEANDYRPSLLVNGSRMYEWQILRTSDKRLPALLRNWSTFPESGRTLRGSMLSLR